MAKRFALAKEHCTPDDGSCLALRLISDKTSILPNLKKGDLLNQLVNPGRSIREFKAYGAFPFLIANLASWLSCFVFSQPFNYFYLIFSQPFNSFYIFFEEGSQRNNHIFLRLLWGKSSGQIL